MEYTSNSPLQTKKIASKILPKLKGKNIICLYGELGAGKTTFVQGLAKALGIKKRLTSPTFILLKEYKVASHQPPATRMGINWKLETGNWKHLIHVDCYRLASEKDLKSIDLTEIWEDKQNLVIIEWAEKFSQILPRQRIDIKFEHTGKNKRKITIDEVIH